MRQRRLKNLDEKLAEYASLIEPDPALWRGRWRACLTEAASDSPKIDGMTAQGCPLYAEIGCGKGQFISRMAQAHPEALFLAVEGNPSVAFYALRKVRAAGIEEKERNVRFVLAYIHHVEDVFGAGELDGIYLNFSDPWPKTRHEKRRLTAGNYLSEYARALRPGGFIEFRTDNDPLFDFSLRQIEAQPELTIEAVSRDLHRDRDPETLITTEYEDKFASAGKNINFVRMRVV